jgi:uncharacterized protein (DUF58 family)
MGNNKMPFPTFRTILLFSAGLVVAIFVQWKLLILLDIVILTFCGLDYVMLIRFSSIDAKRSHFGRMSQGMAQDIRITLFNKGSRPLRIQVRDQTPVEWESAPVMKGEIKERGHLTLDYSVKPLERGLYRFGDIAIRAEGRMGLVSCSISCSATEDVKVYPNLPAFNYSDLSTYRRKAGYWGLLPAKLRGDGREFESLREYVVGDDPRKIHWKATARLDHPIVQEYLPEKNQNVIILIDSGRLMCSMSEGKTKLDHALEAAIRLIHTALAGGDQAGIIVFNDRIITFIPPKKSPDQLQRILDETVSLTPKLVESQYEEALLLLKSKIKKRSLVVIFTDLLDDVASENLISALSILRPTHLPLCVALRESEWDTLLSQRPSNSIGIYKRAVLHETLKLRSMGFKSLIKKGALALDLTPSELSVKTLESYMEVKRKGLL